MSVKTLKSSPEQRSLFDVPEPDHALKYGRELSPQQAKVRDHGAGNQVVVAGAGTGKTEALIQRILKLLVEGDGEGPVPLETILALTFTDKGATEMRERVYSRLVAVLRSSSPGPDRDRLEFVRANFAEKNRILTFDAFSMKLVRHFPTEAGISGDIVILDASQRGKMRREVTRQFWNRVESTFSDQEKHGLWELLDVFSSRAGALETIRNLAENETEADLRNLARLPDETEWRERFQELVSRDGEAMWNAIETEVRSLDLHPELHAELLDAERILLGGKGGIVTQKDWSAAFAKRWTPDLIPGLNRVGRKIREWKAEVLTERDPDLDWRSRHVVAMLCQHALWWRAATREWGEENGVASFADISNAALDLLLNPVLAARIRTGISHLLIDEFQDTNWRQWALIDALRDPNDGNVLIVGDEKQAIFRFRGGDITVFDGVRKLLLGAETQPDELTVSRRSNAQLVRWVNSVFKKVLPSRESRQPYEAPFQSLESGTVSQENGLWTLRAANWHFEEENEKMRGQKYSAALGRERAGRALARFLRALCDDADKWKRSETPALQFPDLREISRQIAREQTAIGIIFATHLVKSTFEEQLRAFNVPFVSVKGSGFWSGEVVTWTLHLLRLLSDATDRLAFVGLARSPLGALSDVALLEWHLASQNAPAGMPIWKIEGFRPSKPEDAVAWSILTSRLEAWQEMSLVEPASEVLEAMLADSDLAFFEAGLPDFAQREENWRKIIDLVREREAAEQGSLGRLIEFFTEMIDSHDAESEADAPLPAGGSIQLMTVFAAKGLGFPMTILAQLDGSPQSRSTLLQIAGLNGTRQMALRLSDEDEDEKNAVNPWLWEKLRAQNQAEEEAQWRRLFYVAATRAESHLVLVPPENEVRSAVAWANLCADEQHEMIELRPVSEIPRAATLVPVRAERPHEPGPDLARSEPRELFLNDLAGTPAPGFGSKVRRFLETKFEAAEMEVREEIPFSAPAAVLGVTSSQWIVGAWEWLARLPSDEFILVASGVNSEIASLRAIYMRLAAKDARLKVAQTWALWPDGEQTEAVLVEMSSPNHT